MTAPGWRWAITSVIALACTGCAINPTVELGRALPDAGIDLASAVPFHPQTEYQCGPAALASVLGASGRPVAPETLAPQVFLPGRQGSLQVELLGATRRAGRVPYPLPRTEHALLAELQAGRPVLVLQNLLTRSVPKWHYAVLVGVDGTRNQVLLHSGKTPAMPMAAPKFMRTWDWGGRWAMVALRPGEMPAGAEPMPYLAAVADFEAVAGAAAATPAYQAAQQRWPDDPRVYLALGNQAVGAGDWRAAADLFRTGLGHAPGDPVLSNNYAAAMGTIGCRAQALRALDAVAGNAAGWAEELDRTREEVSAATAAASPECQRLALPSH